MYRQPVGSAIGRGDGDCTGPGDGRSMAQPAILVMYERSCGWIASSPRNGR